MKRAVSFVLTLVMCLTLAAPALAEAPPAGEDANMEQALADITLLVKNTLKVDDEYTEFSGSFNDGLQRGWNLNWSDEERELYVSCTESGTVTDMSRWTNGAGSRFYGFEAAFPSISEEEARRQALAWLGRLMGADERGRIDDVAVNLSADAAYRFTGRVLKNGLESPVTFRMTIGERGLENYSRSDSYSGYVGEVPPAKTATDKAAAADGLAGAVALELYYVTDGDEARLRYVPVGAYTVVDAQTGEAVDMDELYASFESSGGYTMENEAAADTAAGSYARDGGLTETELSSIENYRDVLSQDELDTMLRGISQLGLEDFQLTRCSYSMGDEGNISARVQYKAEMTKKQLFGFSKSAFEDYMSWSDSATVVKYITANAKTGALESVSTIYPLWDGRPESDGKKAQSTAQAFLEASAPEMYENSALCTLTGYDGDDVVFARTENGYFFPENYLRVTVNTATGTVDDFTYQWDEDAAFAPAAGIIDEAAAKAAYIDALDVTLGYVAWPEGINYDDPVYAKYADWGYTWVESLRLGYYYSGTERVSGVDALTGEAVTKPAGGGFAYDDLGEEPRREAIEALGRAGIGFDGGSFKPGEALTQRDGLVLLMQAQDYNLTDWDDERLKSAAVNAGFIAAADWEPEEGMTRMDFIRMMLGASVYGEAAKLNGVWADGFDGGYAAIASALGMDAENTSDACTRADAAQLLYAFMHRG